jgi:cardiolipin synthase
MAWSRRSGFGTIVRSDRPGNAGGGPFPSIRFWRLMQRTSDSDNVDGAGPTVLVDGNEWTLFDESGPLIAAMVEDIRRARSRIWMESYIFADDDAAGRVVDALAERAAGGVEVRLMIDAWGSFRTGAAIFDRLRQAGVQVHWFHAFSEAIFVARFLEMLNERNHRKLLAIDGRVAYFGGMNVVDASGIRAPADAKNRRLPSSAGWRDVHVRMAGPRASEIADMCDRLWRRAIRQPRDKEPRWSVQQVLGSMSDAFFFFGSRPTFRYHRPHRVLGPLLREAKHDITILVAYFLPLGAVLQELIAARRRGVRVRVIVPGQSDVKPVQWATRHFYEYLLKRGIEVYERKDRMLHSKAIVVDQRWSVIGSCNLDARSLRHNLEFFAVVRCDALAAALLKICRREIEASVRVTAASLRHRSWWQRTVDRAAWALRRWL